MPHIFLCHNKNDRSFAKRLVTPLTNFGIKVWIDEAEIKPGDSLLQKISVGIQNAEYFGVILSPDSVNSSWVQRELEIATTREISNRVIKVIPLLYKACDIPIYLQSKAYLDFQQESEFAANIQRLIYSILPSDFEDRILAKVNRLVNTVFAAYQSIPDYAEYIPALQEIYLPGSAALTRVMQILERHTQRKWVLSDPKNPSTAKIFDTKLEKVIGDTAYVKTQEYWLLKWFDVSLGDYTYLYNNTNEQIYTLRDPDRSGDWKVESNFFPTVNQTGKILPLIDSNEIPKQLFQNAKELQAEIQELLSKGGTEKCLHLLKEHVEPLDASIFKNDIILLSSRFYDLARKRNLDLLSAEEARIIKAQINYGILEIVDMIVKHTSD